MLSFSRNILLVLPLLLAACGFTPVYAPGATGSQVQNNISVKAPSTRDEYLLTQRLEERLGRSGAAAYTLTYSVSIGQTGVAVDRAGSTTRFNLVGTLRYQLTEASTGRVVTSDSIDNFTGYSAAGTTVATFAAERDARKRLMVLLADQIIARILTTDLK